MRPYQAKELLLYIQVDALTFISVYSFCMNMFNAQERDLESDGAAPEVVQG